MLRSRCNARAAPRVRAADVAEQPLEHGARVVLHRHRQRRTVPRDGVAHRARIRVAGARVVPAVERQLERRQLRVLAERLSRPAGRSRCREHSALAAASADAGEKPRRGTRMRALAVGALQPRHHQQLTAEWRQRLEDGCQLEAVPWLPASSGPCRCRWGRRRRRDGGRRGGRRGLGVNAGTIASSRGSARLAPTPRRKVRRGKRHLGDDHDCSLARLAADEAAVFSARRAPWRRVVRRDVLIRNDGLLTMPETIADQR